MKRYFSVFALAARASLTKVLAVTLLAALLCAALLWFAPCHLYDENGFAGAAAPYEQISSDRLVAGSWCQIPALLGLGLVVFLLARTGTGKGVHAGYTVFRLGINPWAVTALWGLYNVITLLFYRAVIALAVYGVVGYRLQEVGPQALLLVSYGNSFLHNLLPLRDIGAWILLGTTTLLTGGECALFSARYWRGKTNLFFPVFFSAAITAGCTMLPMASGMTYLMIFVSLVILGIALYQNCKEGEHESDQ